MADSTASGPSRKQLMIFLSVPISVLVIAIALLTIPSMLARPSYNFIFSSCPTYACGNNFTVNSSGVITESIGRDYFSDRAQLYLYDVNTDSYKPLTLVETTSMQLDPSSVAPDGYRVQYSDKRYGGLFFGGSSESGWQIKKDLGARNLVLPNQNEREIKILAWEVS